VLDVHGCAKSQRIGKKGVWPSGEDPLRFGNCGVFFLCTSFVRAKEVHVASYQEEKVPGGNGASSPHKSYFGPAKEVEAWGRRPLSLLI